jgi:hypothetical protein
MLQPIRANAKKGLKIPVVLLGLVRSCPAARRQEPCSSRAPLIWAEGRGVYDWIGRATAKGFVGFYTNAYYTGVFTLTRTK